MASFTNLFPSSPDGLDPDEAIPVRFPRFDDATRRVEDSFSRRGASRKFFFLPEVFF